MTSKTAMPCLREAKDALEVFLAQRPGTTLADFIERDRRNGTGYMAQSRRVYDGLRIAGLPESAEAHQE